MKVVSSIMPSDSIQSMIQGEFPDVEFSFFKGMKEVGTHIADAEIFITYGEDLNNDHIKKAQKLKWIMVMSAGLEKMPLQACHEKGIFITNARGVHKIPMAEFTFSLLLQHVKQTKLLLQCEREEEWNRRIPQNELHGKTIFILGVGAIGSEIARLAKAFRMNTLGINRSGSSVEFIDELYQMAQFEKVVSRADFLVSVLPSTPETRHLLRLEHFQKMKKSAVLINIGRGDLVKEEVLLQALKEKEITHAYLDVFEEEPLPKGHPFWQMEQVTITPHISSITKNYLPRAFEIFAENLHTYIKKGNQFINVINPKRGY